MEKENFVPQEEKEIKLLAISDFQGAPVEEVLEKIPEDDIDLYIQTGDLAISNTLADLLKEAKTLTEDEVEKLKQDPVFEDLLKKRKRIDIAYANYQQMKNPELQKNILEETRREHMTLIGKLKEEYGDKFVHVWGNYDQKDPKHQEIVRDVLKDYEVTSYTAPHYEEIGDETAIVFWPFQKINNDEDREKLLNWSEELKEKIKDKKKVIVFGHEHVFQGPREEVYKKIVEDAGVQRPTRTPRNQPNPSAKYIMNIFKGLSPEAQGMYVFGHLHYPEEELEKGISYFHEKEGKIPLRVFGLGGKKLPEEHKGHKGRKMIDLVYVPQGMIADIRIGKDEIKVEKK